MSGISYHTHYNTALEDYTEVDANVLLQTVLENIILNAAT